MHPQYFLCASEGSLMSCSKVVENSYTSTGAERAFKLLFGKEALPIFDDILLLFQWFNALFVSCFGQKRLLMSCKKKRKSNVI